MRARFFSSCFVLALVTLWFARGISAAPLFAAQFSTTGATLNLSEYQKDSWQTEDGLPTNNIRMITQRLDGRLLVATGAGLVTFDGEHFEDAQSPLARRLGGDAANAVLLGRDGSWWLGTDGSGLLRQSGDRVTAVPAPPGQAAMRVRMLYQDAQGTVWVGSQYGVDRIVNGALQPVPALGMMAGDLTMPFAEDGHGNMLIVTSAGLFRWTPSATETVTLPASLGKPTAIYRDPQNRIWLGTTGGCTQLRWAGAHWVPGGTPLHTDSPVTTMLGDPAGSVWIGTARSGVYRQSSLGFEHYGVGPGLPAGGIKSIYLDDEDDVWIGTLTGGLSRWRVAAFAPYGRAEGFPADYAGTPFADSHGDLWLGTWDRGLYRLHAGRLQTVSLPGVNSAGLVVRSIDEDNSGSLWVGTWFHGLFRYTSGRFTRFLLGVESPANAVSVVVCDHRGGLWIGTYQGVLYFPGGTPDAHGHTFLKSQLITAMTTTPDGTVLVGTQHGLFRIIGEQAEPVRGLEDQRILSLFVDSLGTAWAAPLSGGLARVSGLNAMAMPQSDEVVIPPAFSMVEDADGYLWLGTARGILRLSLEDLHALSAGTRKTLPALLLNRSSGLRASDCSGRSAPMATRTADGTLWFATTGGFAHSTVVAQTVGTAPSQAALRGWTLTNDAGSGPLLQGSEAVLPAGTPDLVIHFWSKRLSNAAGIQFRYRLDGYDRDWTETGARFARYRWLPAGRFRFEVQSRVGLGAWPAKSTTLTVVQRPSLYQAWWVRAAVALVASVLLWLLIRLRMQRRVLHLKGSMGIVLEERNRIAQECHDTLMAGFAAISWQLEATSNLFRESDAASSPAARSCELARSMVLLCQAEARRIIYDLRETEEVTNFLSKAVRRMLDENHSTESCTLELDVTGHELPLPPGSVHHLTRIAQEAVRNALRHSGAALIRIVLHFDESSLQLMVRDDGCGFDVDDATHARSGHFGLAVMQERARKVGGIVHVRSSEQGSEVEVQVAYDAIGPVADTKEEVVQWIGL